MRTLRWLPMSALAILPVLSGLNCPMTTPSLTDAEKRAVDSAAETAAALCQATTAAQSPANNESSGQQGGSVTFGECPMVTTELDIDADEGIAATLTIDFGTTPCAPAAMPGLLCSGTASGTFNGLSRFIGLHFANLTCGQDVLSGSAEVSFAFSDVGVNLDGTFNLAWTSGEDSITAEGQGLYGYDRGAHASTIATFNGSVSDPEGTYTASFSDVVVSYQNNGNLIPSTGVITLTGPNIRKVTIRFNEDSPSTGEIEVSIDNGAFFTVGLFEL